AAANNSGANNLAAVAYQNSPSGVVVAPRVTSVRSAATRRAPTQVRAATSGVQRVDGSPVVWPGSKHQTVPHRRRQAMVSRTRSVLTLAATTGPSQPRMAGTARAVVLPLWVGPTTATDCARSAATTIRPGRPVGPA